MFIFAHNPHTEIFIQKLTGVITFHENQLNYQDLFKDAPGGLYDGPPNYILNPNCSIEI